jgi:hypothetical protein
VTAPRLVTSFPAKAATDMKKELKALTGLLKFFIFFVVAKSGIEVLRSPLLIFNLSRLTRF